ncbi:hypothetical protein BV25DRAFT_1718714 [Artomyces pyxidatus]|uniref:Uncharacterized protein n=1 Tax=Artomyces pyxidatus TaxID=48021 RepID=A0ACB8SHH5_9AGAM|nr:hypothetical protein BV25DRAFT_1718714 [Artomyces pyxidatus]
MRLIVFEKMEPLIDFHGKEFMTAWVECVKCDYALCVAGIEHREPSLANLMVRVTHTPGGDKLVSGVLNDWDLSNVRGISEHIGFERTDAFPFQALELLGRNNWNSQIERMNHHDLEALMVLPWVFLGMNGETAA